MDNKALGDELRRRREEKKISSRKKLSALILTRTGHSFDAQMIGRYERGELRPPLHYVASFAITLYGEDWDHYLPRILKPSLADELSCINPVEIFFLDENSEARKKTVSREMQWDEAERLIGSGNRIVSVDGYPVSYKEKLGYLSWETPTTTKAIPIEQTQEGGERQNADK